MFKNLEKKASKIYENHKCEICYFAGAAIMATGVIGASYLHDRKIRTGDLDFVMGEREEKPGHMYLGLVLKDKNKNIIKSIYGGDSAEGFKKLALCILDECNKVLNKESEQLKTS